MEEEIIEKVKEVQQLGDLDILQIVTNCQNQNGFKHGDYKRYWNYCRRKVLKLRTQLKLKYGKHKYQAKDIIQEVGDQPKVLQVLLFQAERNWAYALHIKTTHQAPIKQQDNRRSKFHVRNKFIKAISYAQQLETLCQHTTGYKTSVEAKAYSKYLQGQYQFEKKDYEQAQRHFVSSLQIWQELLKASDSYMQVLFQDKIDQLEQSVRYCSHQLQSDLQVMSIEQILQLKNKTGEDVVLAAQLEAMLQQSRAQKLQGVTQKDIIFQQEKITINNEKIIHLMQKIEEFTFNLEQLSQEQVEARMQIYTEVFGLLDEINKLLAKEKEEQKQQDQIVLIIQKTIGYFAFQKQQFVYDRNYMQFKHAEARFIQENTLDLLHKSISRRQFKNKLISPLEMIRWTENLLSALRILQEMQKSEENFKVQKELEFEDMMFRNIKSIYIGCLYYQNNKYLESASLFQYVENLIQNTKGFHNQSMKLKFDYERTYKNKLEQINYYKSQAIGHLQEERIKSEQAVHVGMEGVNLEGKATQHTMAHLLTSPDSYTHLLNPHTLHKIAIADLTPELQMISARPIFLDLGFSQLKYPSIDEKIQKDKGIMGKVFQKFSIFGK